MITIICSIAQFYDKTIPLEETNVKRAAVGESLLNPFLPAHSSPPPLLFLFSKKSVIVSVVVESFKSLT